MSNKSSFKFMPFHWTFEDEIDRSNEIAQNIIRAYGWNELNESVYIYVDDFDIPIWLELPDEIEWTEQQIMKVQIVLKNMYYQNGNNPTTIKRVYKEKLYYANIEKNKEGGYSNKKYSFIEMTFRSLKAISSFTYGLKKKPLRVPGINLENLKIHTAEPSITPVLKLLAIANLPSSSWINCKGIKITDEDKTSTKTHEYKVSWKNLKKMDDEESISMPIVYPKIMSFDNEAYSSVKGSMPNVRNPNDKVFMIGFTMLTQKGKDKEYQKYILSLSDPDEMDGIILKKYKTEANLYIGFSKLIRELDPDIIIGYNIFGWDIPYMHSRATELLRVQTEFENMSAVRGKNAKLKEINWESSAYGKQDLKYLDAEGRLFIDLLPYIKRTYKLSNYRLETVCEEILKDSNKDPLKAKDLFKIWEGKKPDQLSIVAKYCAQDTWVTLQIFEKALIWFDLVESATTNGVPMFYLYTKGQQIKMYAQVLKYCYYNNIIVQSNAYEVKDDENYTGAFVQEPKSGLYEYILPFDFASLYPSIIQAHNIDYSKLINDDIPEGRKIPDELCHIFDWEDHVNCLTGDTEVSFNHLSVTLKNLESKETWDKLLSFDEGQNGILNSTINRFLNQGKKECLQITFQDGSNIKCTPDHKFLNINNNWIEAKELNIDDRLKRGCTKPLHDPLQEFEQCKGYEIKFNTDTINQKTRLGVPCRNNIVINTIQDYYIALAFMRILGYLETDGTIGEKVATLFIGHHLDLQSIIDDIVLVSKNAPRVRRGKFAWIVVIPSNLVIEIKSLEGIVQRKRMFQDASYPEIVFNCPTPLLREYLGGLFGGDGCAPSLNNKANTLGQVSFIGTRHKDNSESLNNIFIRLKDILKNKYDIDSSITFTKEKDDKITFKLGIETSSTLKFKDNIGFRYCCHKNYRLETACSYMRLRDNVAKQRQYCLDTTKQLYEECNKKDKTISEFLYKVQNEMKKNQPILNYYSLPDYDWVHDKIKNNKDQAKRATFHPKHFPTREEYLKDIGAYNFFKDENKICYSVKEGENVLPTFNMKIVDIRSIGIQDVYDIEVNSHHNFIANGIVTHNCNHDPEIILSTQRKKEREEKSIQKLIKEGMSDTEAKEHIRNKNAEKAPPKEKKVVCGHFRYRFLKKDVTGNGVIPTLLTNLLKARKDTRKIIASNKDKIKELKKEGKTEEAENLYDINIVLDKRQNAYKVSANSMYGAMGVKKGYLPLLPGAMCVTAKGRESIKKASAFLENEYKANVIYNDTDSCYTYFPQLEGKSSNEIWDYAEGIVKHMVDISLFPAPMKLEFEEKAYVKFMILTKKRYCAYMMDRDGRVSDKMLIRGIALTRRDNCKFLRNVYEASIRYILNNSNEITKLSKEMEKKEIMNNYKISGLLDLINDNVNDLFQRKYNYKDFVITQGLTKLEYKNKSPPAHFAVAQKMQNRGTPMVVGSRIEYVIIDLMRGYDKKIKKFEKTEDMGYFNEHKEILRIDYLHYLESQGMVPLEELLRVCCHLEDEMEKIFNYRVAQNKVVYSLKKIFETKFKWVE
jgi:DNA polymerase elongation subunit (family B)/intein/homing endonuclease